MSFVVAEFGKRISFKGNAIGNEYRSARFNATKSTYIHKLSKNLAFMKHNTNKYSIYKLLENVWVCNTTMAKIGSVSNENYIWSCLL